MPFIFENLDARTRGLMAAEVDHDCAISSAHLNPSSRLTLHGETQWEKLLRAAIDSGDEMSLTNELGLPGGLHISGLESKPSKTGKPIRVRHDAGAVLAQSEFNRLYIRALCVRALQDRVEVEVYRARYSNSPDLASEQKIGHKPVPDELLQDLRSSIGVATALGLPSHPNSGLSIRVLQ